MCPEIWRSGCATGTVPQLTQADHKSNSPDLGGIDVVMLHEISRSSDIEIHRVIAPKSIGFLLEYFIALTMKMNDYNLCTRLDVRHICCEGISLFVQSAPLMSDLPGSNLSTGVGMLWKAVWIPCSAMGNWVREREWREMRFSAAFSSPLISVAFFCYPPTLMFTKHQVNVFECAHHLERV